MRYKDFIESRFLIDEPKSGKLIPFLFRKVQIKYYNELVRDYDIEKMDQDERKIIESYGGSFAFIPFVNNISTSQIIRKIQGKDK